MAAILRCPPSISVSVPCAALGASLHSSLPISRKPSLPCSRACRAGVRCSAANKPSPSPPTAPDRSEVSSMARIRSEVLSPFRSVRMFFYFAFMASGALGGLIALTQLLPALSNPADSAGAAETLKGLGIDAAAVALFAFLYSRESKAKDAQVARLAREERLSRLKLRAGAGEGRPLALGELRGTARLVIVAGPGEFVAESFRRSQPLLRELAERAVLAVPFATDGNTPELRLDEGGVDDDDLARRSRRLWQLTPVYTTEWAQWLDDQKKLAGVPPDSPVYLSLRMDGRVRGSGVGYPPWQAFVAQLPPVKGMWSGLLDGMDGRVL
ncbi:protein LOW PSII ACCUMULATION 1, chloroplastic isoform X2 [Panicum miliaceum]|uniref:Protein LOW PSII ACCUMULATION 1, chloroplastic isoform X2 n=1 Tax=Panicum miliaceum TaxID=4540 RepID=A0A3L6Q4E0_PANMI|nr:protein LOW PSII ACCUMULATION 1, chloroplastic isoform X2 [Panicum miliaceum]